jgi:ADP-ribose pyrophosphatase YjhB (NUDIX family)
MKFIWHKDTNFQYLNPITQVYGVCFDQGGKILILKEMNKEWNIPGGKPESNETPIQTLKRELAEEVDVEIDKCRMIGYFEVLSDSPTIYQLRFACRVKKINLQTPDPASNFLNERKFVIPNEFFDYVKIEDYRPMIDEAIKWFKKI